MARRVRKTFRVFDGEGMPRTIELIGRDAWALGALIHAGPVGCTPITTPGPRWSGYVHKLRRRHGLNIVTIDEEHGGPYAGTHARYVLRSRVEFVDDQDDDRPNIRPDAEQRATA